MDAFGGKNLWYLSIFPLVAARVLWYYELKFITIKCTFKQKAENRLLSGKMG
jgi:hypothetical protein